jgi:hypothetical protein
MVGFATGFAGFVGKVIAELVAVFTLGFAVEWVDKSMACGYFKINLE